MAGKGGNETARVRVCYSVVWNRIQANEGIYGGRLKRELYTWLDTLLVIGCS